MNGNITVIDLCSDDEDCEEPSTARRFEVDTIDGLEVFSFSNSAELEFFSNHVSPFTSKDDCDFRGFEEGGTSSAEYRSFFKKSLKRLLPNDDSVLVDANFPKPIKSICKQKTIAKLIPNPKFSRLTFPKPVIVRKSSKMANFLNGAFANLDNREDAKYILKLPFKSKDQIAEIESLIAETSAAVGQKCHNDSKKSDLLVGAHSQISEGCDVKSSTVLVPSQTNCALPKISDSNNCKLTRRGSPQRIGFTGPSSIFDDAVIDVVNDLVDFVSRKESFGRIPVLQDPKTGSDLSKLPPCGKEYCVLGCVCYSVSRKNTRRYRCSNADCILGCCCWAKSVRLRSGDVRPPERFEILKGAEPVLTNEVTTFSAPATKKPKLDGSMQPPAYESRILQKPESEQPPSKADKIGSIDKLIAAYRSLSSNKWKPNGIRKPHYSPWETFKKKKPIIHVVKDVHNKSVHKQYPLHSKSANNKVEEISKEVPPHALMCLTPGVGFLPLEELTLTKIQFRNPFAPSVVKNFSSVKSATEWLDKMCEEKFTYGPDITHLKWMVADAQIIKRKEFKRMDINALTDPRCQITRTGLVFT